MASVNGISNNPNGRPKKGMALSDALRKYLSNKISITETDNKGVKITKKVEIRDALIRKTVQMALGGDQVAMKLVWNYMDGMPRQVVANESTFPEGVPITMKLDKSEESRIERELGLIFKAKK